MSANDIDEIAKAIGRIPSGLFIVTVAAGGAETGFLGSFVQQVSIAPPLIACGISPSRPAYDLIKKATHFGLHVVEEGAKQWLGHFGRGFAPGEEAFEGLRIDRSKHGVPLIQEMPVRLVLKFRNFLEPGGDHVLAIGEAVDAEFPSGDLPKSWIHLRKNGRNY